MTALIVPVSAPVDVSQFWTCGCVFRKGRSPLARITHTKAIPRTVTACRTCGVTLEQTDRANAALAEDGKL